MINGRGSQRGSHGNGSSRGTLSPTLGPLSSEPDEGLVEAKNTTPTMREDALIPMALAEEDGVEVVPDVGAISSGIYSFAPSPSLNVFTNIFNVSGMDWMGKKLKNLTISPLPLVATTPFSAANDEDVVSPFLWLLIPLFLLLLMRMSTLLPLALNWLKMGLPYHTL